MYERCVKTKKTAVQNVRFENKLLSQQLSKIPVG